MKINLNEAFLNYYYGNIKKNDIVSAVYSYLITNQSETVLSHWESNKYEDFISWFYPRLNKCVDSYKDTGASFEAFINKFILIASREYHTRSVINAVVEYSTWNARLPDMYTHEEPPVYDYISKDSKIEKTITDLIVGKRGQKNVRRILFLVLKCYYFVSDDFAEMIAPMLGMKPNELLRLLNKMRELRQRKDNYIYEFKERIFCQYYRCAVIEKRASIVKENTIAHKRLKVKLEKGRQRLENMRIRKAKIRTEATNKQIADILGVQKGTVDSSLYKLKQQWKKMSEKADLN